MAISLGLPPRSLGGGAGGICSIRGAPISAIGASLPGETLNLRQPGSSPLNFPKVPYRKIKPWFSALLAMESHLALQCPKPTNFGITVDLANRWYLLNSHGMLKDWLLSSS